MSANFARQWTTGRRIARAGYALTIIGFSLAMGWGVWWATCPFSIGLAMVVGGERYATGAAVEGFSRAMDKIAGRRP